MKYQITKFGSVQFTSESAKENYALHTFFVHRNARLSVPTEVEPTKRKHKKHNFVKVCDVCSKGHKGLMGLNIHRYKIHGIRSENYLKNHKFVRPDSVGVSIPIKHE